MLPDSTATDPIKRVLLCTGKVYYELAAHREAHKRADVAIVRLEQLYPLSAEQIEAALPPCPPGTRAFWVQEEPENMGAWRYVHDRFGAILRGHLPLRPISRPESASPATGSAGAHKLEQDHLIERAFGVEQAATPTRVPTTAERVTSDG